MAYYYALSIAILLSINKLHFCLTKRKYNLEGENKFIPFILCNALTLLIALIHNVYLKYFC
jgi:hypothetical protein